MDETKHVSHGLAGTVESKRALPTDRPTPSDLGTEGTAVVQQEFRRNKHWKTIHLIT